MPSIPFAFFGTSRFAETMLEEMKRRGLRPSIVVTAPDRPAGRGLKPAAPPVKKWALKNKIPVLQPETLDRILSVPEVKLCLLALLAGYGKIIPKRLIEFFPRGILNAHPSLLPKYRGPSPIQSQILSDDGKVGVSIILMDEKIDHGPVIAKREVSVAVWPPKSDDLEKTLARAGGKMAAEILPLWLKGSIKPEAQNHAEAVYTKKLKKQDGLLRFSDPPYKNYLKIQALTPWPETYFFADIGGVKKRLVVKKASFKNGRLAIERVVPEGGKEMDYRQFLRAYSPNSRERSMPARSR